MAVLTWLFSSTISLAAVRAWARLQVLVRGEAGGGKEEMEDMV